LPLRSRASCADGFRREQIFADFLFVAISCGGASSGVYNERKETMRRGNDHPFVTYLHEIASNVASAMNLGPLYAKLRRCWRSRRRAAIRMASLAPLQSRPSLMDVGSAFQHGQWQREQVCLKKAFRSLKNQSLRKHHGAFSPVVAIAAGAPHLPPLPPIPFLPVSSCRPFENVEWPRESAAPITSPPRPTLTPLNFKS
jgi:hypothetical protein